MQQSHPLSAHVSTIATGAQIATVDCSEKGRPLTVKMGGLVHTVELVDAHLPHTQPGDLVMVQNCQGVVVVTHKLQRPGDHPAPHWRFVDQQWQLSCQHTLKFQCGDAFIELQPNGQLTIEGRDLLAYAERTHRIQGSRIELN